MDKRAKLPKGVKRCNACRKQKPVEMFAWNQGRCFDCKADLDKIYGICKRQGKSDWLKEQRDDEEKLLCLVRNYQDHMTLFNKGEVPNKWNMVTYMEEVKAATEMLIADQGKLMNETQYMYWYTLLYLCT